MDDEEKKVIPEEEDCASLTDEEFKAYQEKDRRTTAIVFRFFKVIWEAISFFFSS